MIRGAVLLGVGAVAGVAGSRWVRRRARALTPAGLADTVADRAADARDGLRELARDVREVADRRERELYARLGAPAARPGAADVVATGPTAGVGRVADASLPRELPQPRSRAGRIG